MRTFVAKFVEDSSAIACLFGSTIWVYLSAHLLQEIHRNFKEIDAILGLLSVYLLQEIHHNVGPIISISLAVV